MYRCEDQYDDREYWEKNKNKMSISKWYDLDGELHKWPHIKLDFLDLQLDPISETYPFFKYDEKKAWGKRNLEVAIRGRKKRIKYHK